MTFGVNPPAWTGPGAKVIPGWWEISPPMGGWPTGSASPQAPNQGWLNSSNRFNSATAPETWGFLDMRHKDKGVTVMSDGHVEMLGLSDLRDMRRWSNKADRANYNFRPAP
jgi:hypothetical protein